MARMPEATVEDASLDMTRSTSGAGGSAPGGASPEQIRESLARKHVCPFCGSANDADHGVCPRCTMENSAASRKATKSRIGPWYVLQTRNPAAPGMKFDTLLAFVKKGRVKPRSIVRGPTTHQLWRFAAHVKGLSREFGVCYSCGGNIEATASLCPQCNRLQDPPANPDVLLETKDTLPPPAAAARQSPEPQLAVDETEFVVPALGGSEDSLSGVTMAGVAFDAAWSRQDPAAAAAAPSPAQTFHPHPRPAAAAKAPPASASASGSTSGNGRGSPGNVPHPNAEPDEEFAVGSGYRPAPAPANGHAAGPNGFNNANGFGGAGPSSAKKRDGDGFLTARDLAAAFKLDFSPRAEYDAADARVPANPAVERRRAQRAPKRELPPQRPARVPPVAEVYETPAFSGFPDEESQDSFASAFEAPISRPARVTAGAVRPRRRHPLLKTLAVLILLGGAAGGGALYFDEGLRQQSFDWFAKVKTSLLTERPAVPAKAGGRSSSDPLKWKPSHSPNSGTIATDAGASSSSSNVPAPASPDIIVGPANGSHGLTPRTDASKIDAAPLAGLHGDASLSSQHLATGNDAGPPPAAAPAPPSPERAAPAEPKRVEAPVTLAPPPPTPSPAPVAAPAAAAHPAPDPAVAAAEAFRLYRDAIDAESRDLNLAIAKYKAVKRYPDETWPTDLDTRLRSAEARLKAQQQQP